MANFDIPAPYEPDKTSFLHDRETRPDAPSTTRLEMAKRWSGLALGLVLSVGFTALLFSVRDSWDNHREWLVTTIPLLVIAGIAMGHLIVRGQVKALAPGGAFLFLALIFAGADVFADNDSAASDTARDVLSILAGICLGAAVVGFTIALAWVELRNPTKAPTPEL